MVPSNDAFIIVLFWIVIFFFLVSYIFNELGFIGGRGVRTKGQEGHEQAGGVTETADRGGQRDMSNGWDKGASEV